MTGQVRAVLLDWAGTTVDHGSLAPTRVFLEVFRQRGVDITLAEARGPMGRAKRDHIAAIAASPRVAEAWRQRHGRVPGEIEVQAMYDDFLPIQKEALKRGSDVIAGVPEAIAGLRRQGIRIGSSTGYTRELMEVVAPIAARQGYAPDAIVCADDVAWGRPAPDMNLRAAELLGVTTMGAVVVVDDTPVGIEAGRAAGAITVAVSRTGNALGLSEAEAAALDTADLADRLREIEREFRALGADHVIPSVADLPGLVARW